MRLRRSRWQRSRHASDAILAKAPPAPPADYFRRQPAAPASALSPPDAAERAFRLCLLRAAEARCADADDAAAPFPILPAADDSAPQFIFISADSCFFIIDVSFTPFSPHLAR